MSTEQNKAVVRRFITEVLVGGNVDLVDDLLAADYVNRGMGGMDRAAFKAWLTVAPRVPAAGWRSRTWSLRAMPWSLGSPTRSRSPRGSDHARGLTYYRLADGRIVEDDPITSPDLTRCSRPDARARLLTRGRSVTQVSELRHRLAAGGRSQLRVAREARRDEEVPPEHRSLPVLAYGATPQPQSEHHCPGSAMVNLEWPASL